MTSATRCKQCGNKLMSAATSTICRGFDVPGSARECQPPKLVPPQRIWQDSVNEDICPEVVMGYTPNGIAYQKDGCRYFQQITGALSSGTIVHASHKKKNRHHIIGVGFSLHAIYLPRATMPLLPPQSPDVRESRYLQG